MIAPAHADTPEGNGLQGVVQSRCPLEGTTPMARTLPSRPAGTVQEQINDLRAILSALCMQVQRATEGRAGRPQLTLIRGGKS